VNTPSENHPQEQPVLEGNIARLIAALDRWPGGADEPPGQNGRIRYSSNGYPDNPPPVYSPALLAPVLAEVRLRRHRRVRRRVLVAGIFSMSAAAAVVVAILMPWNIPPREVPSPVADVGQVKAVSGLALLTGGETTLQLAGKEGVAAGDWLQTAWGSRAEVLLSDESTLVVQPHTRLQINAGTGGKSILLDDGQISLDVAKQPPDKALTITTPESQVTVVGTSLEVQVLTKSDGRKQTRVDVFSGHVKLASGGRSVTLLPNMQGVADEGQPPFARSQTEELNELARLAARRTALAAEAGIPAGSAAIIEFQNDRSATVWTLVEIDNSAQSESTECLLECDLPNCSLEFFSLSGARLAATGQDRRWRVDLSAEPLPPGGTRTLVAKVGNVPGLFAMCGPGVLGFDATASQPPRLSLLQLRLPASARVEQITPPPLENRCSLGRRVLTISSNCQLPKVVHQGAE
jgi:hypothetical protein